MDKDKPTERQTDRQGVTRLSCEDERMLLTHGLSAEAIIIGDKSTRTNRSGSDRNTQQQQQQQHYENMKHVIEKAYGKRNVTLSLFVKINNKKTKIKSADRCSMGEAVHTKPILYCTHPDKKCTATGELYTIRKLNIRKREC